MDISLEFILQKLGEEFAHRRHLEVLLSQYEMDESDDGSDTDNG